MITNSQQLESWGYTAASAFLADQKCLMTDSIEKIAKENILNKEQIQRVCEFANHRAYEELSKSAADKRFEFPVADINEVVNRIKDIPDVDTAGMNTVLASNDWSKLAFVKEDMDNIHPFGSDEIRESLIKTAKEHMNKELTTNEQVGIFLKISEAKDKLNAAEVEYESEQTQTKQAMKKVIKGLMDDGHSFEDLYKTAVASNPDRADSIKTLFDDMAKDMKMPVKLASADKVSTLEKLAAKAFLMKKLSEVKATEHDVKYLKGKNDLVMAITQIFKNEEDMNTLKAARSYTDTVIDTARGKIIENEYAKKAPKTEDK